ncbi:hypothetical protein H5410_036725 [Solanum commersonii]|uniref:Uncharacterized protein n=1 Tax=Solanum commersonii TaxID=4109 RepID=A0A9J5Y5N7_SOLCO|nr:hypothetical protein H5410_036725 [Solanum commersonii]
MNNEIQKLKTNKDNLKSKASQQHNYKNAELRTSKQVSDKQHKNVNLNQLFKKPFTQRTPRHMSMEPQTSTYADSLQNQNEKKTSNYIARTYIENIHKIQTYLNLNPRSTTKEPNQDYLTQKLQGYNKLIAWPKSNANLVRTCYNYGLLNTVYTYDGEEVSGIPELHKTFVTYKKIPSFYANKRIIGILTIIQELTNNYLNGNAIWKEQPTTRALKAGFISTELLTRYCKLIGHKYPDHICLKCNGEDNIIQMSI